MRYRMRIAVFMLASTSIAALLGEMYGLWRMGLFTFGVATPAFCILMGIMFFDQTRSDGRLGQMIGIGAVAGLVAAASYDVFRLPFVFSARWGLQQVVPPLPLFKVFPQFGAMILGTHDSSSTAAKALGWLYHFSNGVTFGIMYAALINGQWRARWPVAIPFALALELAMLFSPYPATFGIKMTTSFVVVTLAAHTIFGLALAFSSIQIGARMTKC